MAYRKVEIERGGVIVDAFEFTDSLYKNIIFSYSEVKLFEEKNQAKLSFKYHIHSDKLPFLFKEKKFKQKLGDLLMELIQEGLKNNEIVYKNGTDEGVVRYEDRDDDFIELDDE